MEFNINDDVEVELTEHGIKILNKFICDYYADVDLCHVTMPHGKFQVWELMQIFGKHMGNGAKQIFKSNVIRLVPENN